MGIGNIKPNATMVILTIAILTLLVVNCNDQDVDTNLDDIGLGSKRHYIDINGQSSAYLLHTPSNWTNEERLPLIFMFDGTNGDAFYMESYTGMSSLADDKRFFVVYPWALELNWDLDPSSRTVDLIDQLITSINISYNIDLDRVYAVGFSMGAILVHVLACPLGDQLAGIASISGYIPPTVQDSCDRKGEVNVLIINGTSDSVVQYHGEEEIDYYNQLYNCNDDLTEINISADLSCSSYSVIQKTYTSCDNYSQVRLLRVEGGEHNWFCFSSLKIWEFFNE